MNFSNFARNKASILIVAFAILALALGIFSTGNLAALLREGDYLFNLVTKQNSLDRYSPNDLVELTDIGFAGRYVREVAYEPLKNLINVGKQNGVNLVVLSAYRSYEQQKDLHDYYTRNYPDADRFSAEAGHSEHQLGTTVDFGVGHSGIDLTQNFADTAESIWLEEHAAEYGFVMSYPRGKEHITGYIYEPWHYRFIGREAAEDFLSQNVSLVEYLERSPQYYVKESLYQGLVRLRGHNEVYYVTSNGYKRHIPSPEVFESYGNDWHDILLIDPDTLESLPTAKLINLNNDPKVFLLTDSGVKRWIIDAKIFEQMSYPWEGISPVNMTEFNFYRTGSAIFNISEIENIDNTNVSEIILHSVPFAAQAPLGNWADPRQQNGCEEVAVLMAMKWVNYSMNLPAQEAIDTIIAISDWELATYGEFRDSSVDDTAQRIFREYFNYHNIRVEKNITAEDIKRELRKGNLVIAPANGRKLNNPFFTLPGPIEHMLVVIGYDPNTDEFITNENGTRHGKGYRYKASAFQNALQDYPTGFHLPIEKIEKNMIVVSR